MEQADRMAKIIEQVCVDCIKKENCCCKNCFENDESYIFEPLSRDELDFLIEEKQQIVYNPEKLLSNKIHLQPL